MTEAREHDRKFLYHLKLAADSWLVFDKAYNVFHQFAKWTEQKIWFVTRMKDNAELMAKLENITNWTYLSGVMPNQTVEIIDAVWHGPML